MLKFAHISNSVFVSTRKLGYSANWHGITHSAAGPASWWLLGCAWLCGAAVVFQVISQPGGLQGRSLGGLDLARCISTSLRCQIRTLACNKFQLQLQEFTLQEGRNKPVAVFPEQGEGTERERVTRTGLLSKGHGGCGRDRSPNQPSGDQTGSPPALVD